MKTLGYFCLTLSLIFLTGCASTIQTGAIKPANLKIYPEEYPPVTFMKNGKVIGFVTDMVREISARQGIPDNIRLTSWDEAYNVALSNPNVVLFSTERTDKR